MTVSANFNLSKSQNFRLINLPGTVGEYSTVTEFVADANICRFTVRPFGPGEEQKDISTLSHVNS